MRMLSSFKPGTKFFKTKFPFHQSRDPNLPVAVKKGKSSTPVIWDEGSVLKGNLLQDIHGAGHEPDDVILVLLQVLGEGDQKIRIRLLGQLGMSRHVLCELTNSYEIGHVPHVDLTVRLLVLAIVIDLKDSIVVESEKPRLPSVSENSTLVGDRNILLVDSLSSFISSRPETYS